MKEEIVKPRMSALPVLQYCGQSQIITSQGAGGRSSAIGTAFHAKCSKAENAQELYLRLSDREREQLDELICPTPITVGEVELSYETATKEFRILLGEDGGHVDELDDHLAEITGTTDLFWIHEVDGRRIAFVADIKKTKYAAPDGPYSLQAIGYAIGVVSKFQCDGYYTGIWDATEGEWSWSVYFDLWSIEHEHNVSRVLAAAANFGGEFNVGSHCKSCYGRTRCPQFLLPPELADTALEPFTREGGLTHETACAALVAAQRAKDSAEHVIELLKSFSQDNGGILDASRGKLWAPVKRKGKTSLDRKQLEQDHPELVSRYVRFGSDYEAYQWINAPKEKK